MFQDTIKSLRNKDNKTISKCISLVENKEKNYLELLSSIYPYTGNAYRIGITGPPGAGKSSLTDKMLELMIAKKLSVAVIAIDPSSPFNGGAILGDRIRFLNNFMDNDIFFRSMSTRGSQGGLSSSSKLVSDIFDACGYDVIIFETIGVGQIEIDIIEAADTVVVTLVPESGDDIQMMKSGLMEIADLYAINKSDRQGADKLYSSLNKVLQLNEQSDWNPQIVKTVATTGLGVDELYSSIMNHKTFIDKKNIRVKKGDERYVKTIESLISSELMKKFWSKEKKDFLDKELKKQYQKRLSPYEIIDKFL